VFQGATPGLPSSFGQSLGNLGGAFAPGGAATQGFNTGLSTGFTPGIATAFEAALRPGAELAKEHVTGDIFANQAKLGTLTGSGTSTQVGDASAQIENQLLAQVGQVQGQAQLQGQQIQGALANSTTPTAGLNALQPYVQSSQQLPFNLANTLFGGIGQLPFSQPQQQPNGPSKTQSLLPIAGQLGSAYIASRGAGKS
jgi:hypothetical protein